MKRTPLADLVGALGMVGSVGIVGVTATLCAMTPASAVAQTGAALPEVGLLRPRVNTVTLRKDDFSCDLPRYTGLADGTNAASLRQLGAPDMKQTEADYCNGEASLELNFQIDMFGSKVVTRTVNGRQVSTEAGKFFVVTVSPEAQAGAGWHIADDLRRNRDFSTAVGGLQGRARSESVGPLVSRYQFWVRKPSDREVTLVEKFPANTEKMVSIHDTRSITAGVTGTVSGRVNLTNTNGGSESTGTGTSTSTSAGGSASTTVEVGTKNSTSTLNQTEVTTGKDPGTKQINGTTVLVEATTGNKTETGTNFSNTTGASTSTSNSSNFSRARSGEQSSQLEGQMQQSNSRQLVYSGSEYVIDNKSSATLAKWVWDLKLEDDQERICDYLSKRDLNTCFFTLPLMDDKWIVNAGKFTAATHANFVPAFQAVFKAPSGFSRTTTFELGTSVTLASLLAAARPGWSPALLEREGSLVEETGGKLVAASTLKPDVLRFSADLKSGAAQSVTESFTVDWDQPYFAPEQNIRLQVMSPFNGLPETRQTLCLSANFNAQTNASADAIVSLQQANAELAAAQRLLEQAIAGQGDRNAADRAVALARRAVTLATSRSGDASAFIPAATLERCNAKKEQLWGYDAEEKLFKSRAVKGADYCLAYPNLDRRLSNDNAIEVPGEPNKVVIMPCNGMDNTQKWELRADGYLYNAVSLDNKALSFYSEAVYKLDRYGDPLVENGSNVLQRNTYTGMLNNGRYQMKFQALPAVY